jgi:hypothetical protein
VNRRNRRLAARARVSFDEHDCANQIWALGGQQERCLPAERLTDDQHWIESQPFHSERRVREMSLPRHVRWAALAIAVPLASSATT